MRRSISLVLALGFSLTAFEVFTPHVAHAQSLLDALRLSTETLPSGGRGTAMDGSLIAGVKDYSAIDFNPAALAPLERNEIGFGLWNRNHNSTADFLGTSNDATETYTGISTLGGAFPFKTVRGHFAIGISYDRVRDYSSSYKFSAVNPSSSFLNTQGFIQDPHTTLTGQDRRDYLDQNNLAWMLNLTRDVSDSGAEVLRTIPFNGGLKQSGLVTEEGGMRALRVGAGVDIAEGVSIGATLNAYFGSYDYIRDYTEEDVNGLYASAEHLHPLDFQKATITDSRHQDQTGIGLKLGLLAYPNSIVRFGLTVETPTYLHIDDAFSRSGSASFTNGDYFTSGSDPSFSTIVNSYDVVTPLRTSAGASATLAGATLAASVSYADMRQLRFSNADVDLSDLNRAGQEDLRGVFSWHLGAEYVIAPVGVSVRAGYGVEPSPYRGDSPDYDTKTLSGGLGVLLSKSMLLEASLRHSSYHTNHAIYNDRTVEGALVGSNITDDAASRNDVAITLSYRY